MTSRYRPRLQHRLMWAFAGYTALVSVLFGLFAMAFVYMVEDEFFDNALRVEAQRQMTSRAAGHGWREPAQDFIRLYRPDQALPDDLARARKLEPRARELSGDEGRHYHLWPLPEADGLLVAEVGTQLVVRPFRHHLLGWLLAWGGSLVLLALGLGWWLARRTSAPLARLAQAIAESRPEQLPTHLEHSFAPDEVGLLAAHLTRLNERTQEFIAREQAFTRDASHELRTPLAVLRLACEDLQRQGRPEQKALLGTLSTAIWQLQQTVDLLMALAREEGPPTLAAPELPDRAAGAGHGAIAGPPGHRAGHRRARHAHPSVAAGPHPASAEQSVGQCHQPWQRGADPHRGRCRTAAPGQ
jgi:HAMP domain-containing protein